MVLEAQWTADYITEAQLRLELDDRGRVKQLELFAQH